MINDKIKQRGLILITLLVWGGLILWFKLVQFSPYGIEEGASRALLLMWSLAERVNTTAVLLTHDFRTLIFVPLALYWSGSLVAAKVFTLLAFFAGTLFFYRWAVKHLDGEVALIASGLLLIAPLSLQQIDAMGAGVYLLLTFGLGSWLDQRIRDQEKLLSAWYFIHMIVIAAIISMHPIGLGYALGVLWSWQRKPINNKLQKQILIGVGVSAIIIGLLQAGWIHIEWFNNPITTLGSAIFKIDDTNSGAAWFAGALVLTLFAIAAIRSRQFIVGNSLASSLLLASLIGLLCADKVWALLLLTLLLYLGTQQLIHAQKFGMRGFMAQRGLALMLLFIIAFVFMQGDKAHYNTLARGDFGENDRLIETLVASIKDDKQKLQISSQWPGRTMLAIKQATLPLPPASDDDEYFIEITKGFTHIIFDHTNPKNTALARQIARLSGNMSTLTREPGGVIIEVHAKDKTP
ncbi:MAG: hypothetical protein COB61_003700 [Thiotrichales bacterium]|nr:hypothetical protein [Thiotrichales bacterium]